MSKQSKATQLIFKHFKKNPFKIFTEDYYDVFLVFVKVPHRFILNAILTENKIPYLRSTAKILISALAKNAPRPLHIEQQTRHTRKHITKPARRVEPLPSSHHFNATPPR